MGAVPLGHSADQLLQAAQEQTRGEQMLRAALGMAMQNPHTVMRVGTHQTGIRDENGMKVLMIARPDGSRIDIELSSPAAVSLARALVPMEEQAA